MRGKIAAAEKADAEHHAEAEGHMQQPGHQRRLAALFLQREGENQQEAGIGGLERHRERQADAEAANGEQRWIEQRRAALRDPARNMAPAGQAQGHSCSQTGQLDPAPVRFGRPHHRPQRGGDSEAEQRHADHIVSRRARRTGLGQIEPAGQHGQCADRQVDQEDNAPAQPQHIRLDQQPADDRPGNRGKAADHPEHRQFGYALQRLEQHLQQRHELRRHDRAGRPLQQPRGDQLVGIRRHAAGQRGESETGDAPDEHPPIAEAVAQPAARHQQQRETERITRDDPLRGFCISAHIGLDRRQRGVDDGQVDNLENQRDDQRQQRQRLLARGHVSRRGLALHSNSCRAPLPAIRACGAMEEAVSECEFHFQWGEAQCCGCRAS